MNSRINPNTIKIMRLLHKIEELDRGGNLYYDVESKLRQANRGHISHQSVIQYAQGAINTIKKRKELRQ